MAKRVKPQKSQNSAAQAAEDLSVMFPDSAVMIAGKHIVVSEYPFIRWLEIRVQHGELIEELAALLEQNTNIEPDEILEFFENHFQEIQVLLLESIHQPQDFLSVLSDEDMQNLLFKWWLVNKHFFLRSAFRLLRTKLKQLDGQTSFNSSSATTIPEQN